MPTVVTTAPSHGLVQMLCDPALRNSTEKPGREVESALAGESQKRGEAQALTSKSDAQAPRDIAVVRAGPAGYRTPKASRDSPPRYTAATSPHSMHHALSCVASSRGLMRTS